MMKNQVLSTIMTAAVLVVGASQYAAAMAGVKDAIAQNPPNRSTEQSSSTPRRDSIQFEPISPSESPVTIDPSFVLDRGIKPFPSGVLCKWLPWCREEPEQLHPGKLRNNPNVPSDSQLPRTPRLGPSPSQLRRER